MVVEIEVEYWSIFVVKAAHKHVDEIDHVGGPNAAREMFV